jgi:glycosyltransferase involved in cell wall biosynthesis
MSVTLSCCLIAKNAEATLPRTLSSLRGIADEIILVDDGSSDATREIGERYDAHVLHYSHPSEGAKRIEGLHHVSGDWVLVLDTDEEVPGDLREEIRKILRDPHARDCYDIPFRNFFLGRPMNHGGEYYSQMRLFRRNRASVVDTPIHAYYDPIPGATRAATNAKLNHYSYRSLTQLFGKFTDYARREATRKAEAGERTGLKKLTMYPAHMFWARFVEDKGYRDGIFRIPLDLAFAYMEFMTYWYMLGISPREAISTPSGSGSPRRHVPEGGRT